MTGANTDVESLRTAQRGIVEFYEETETFWRGANYAFASFEDEVEQYRQELIQKIEEMGASSHPDMDAGISSELASMLYEDEYANRQDIAELEAKLDELRKHEQVYLDYRDTFIGNMRTLLQGCSDNGVATHGLPTLIQLLDEYLGR